LVYGWIMYLGGDAMTDQELLEKEFIDLCVAIKRFKKLARKILGESEGI